MLADGRLLFTGTPDELISPIQDRLWSTDLEPASGLVLSSRLIGKRRHYRILAEAPPQAAVRSEPTLEDGYLAVLQDNFSC